MSYETLVIETHGERCYDITKQVQATTGILCTQCEVHSGILHLFIMHTSCALVISEAYDPTARQDLESFLKHLAPRDLPFIKHTLEGDDDSPSHMKSALLHQTLALPVEEGALLLGRWQGIYLAEFRDAPHSRQVIAKFQPDNL